MGNTDKHPLDFDALRKGDVIGKERLETILGCSFESKDYQLKVLGLQSQIEREMESRGIFVTTTQKKGAIHICTDAEAAEENHARFNSSVKAIFRHHYRMMGVDTTKLDIEEEASFRRKIESQSKVIQGIALARPKLLGATYRRTLPSK